MFAKTELHYLLLLPVYHKYTHAQSTLTATQSMVVLIKIMDSLPTVFTSPLPKLRVASGICAREGPFPAIHDFSRVLPCRGCCPAARVVRIRAIKLRRTLCDVIVEEPMSSENLRDFQSVRILCHCQLQAGQHWDDPAT